MLLPANDYEATSREDLQRLLFQDTRDGRTGRCRSPDVYRGSRPYHF